MLARNSDLNAVVHSIDSIEQRFNRLFHYPYVFLDNEPFETRFTEAVAKHASGRVEFGVIPESMWGYPKEDWFDRGAAEAAVARQGERDIQYGGLESYHHMCRFFSGYV